MADERNLWLAGESSICICVQPHFPQGGKQKSLGRRPWYKHKDLSKDGTGPWSCRGEVKQEPQVKQYPAPFLGVSVQRQAVTWQPPSALHLHLSHCGGSVCVCACNDTWTTHYNSTLNLFHNEQKLDGCVRETNRRDTGGRNSLSILCSIPNTPGVQVLLAKGSNAETCTQGLPAPWGLKDECWRTSLTQEQIQETLHPNTTISNFPPNPLVHW